MILYAFLNNTHPILTNCIVNLLIFSVEEAILVEYEPPVKRRKLASGKVATGGEKGAKSKKKIFFSYNSV